MKAAALLREYPAASVLAYFACENEVPTNELIELAARSGRAVYLPQSASGAVVRWQAGAALAIGPGGVSEPTGVALHGMCPEIAFIPVVAWNRQGTRLGRGGGFYDRLLGRCTQTLRIGLAYEFQEYADIPRDPWDVALHYVITERRVVCCGQSGEVAPTRLQKGGMRT